ncbi:MAG: HNH endonuclease [Microcystaceae cyanobacterium]
MMIFLNLFFKINGETRMLNSKQKKSKKSELSRLYGEQCWLCKNNFPLEKLTLDHLIPQSCYGSHHIVNLRLACRDCNRKRGNKIDVVVLSTLTGCKNLCKMTLKAILESLPDNAFKTGCQLSDISTRTKIMENFIPII